MHVPSRYTRLPSIPAVLLAGMALGMALLLAAPVHATVIGSPVPKGSPALPFLMWSAGANNGFGGYIPVASLPASALGSQSANAVLAGPGTGAAASPTFRGLVTADIPSQLPASVGVGTAAAADALTVATTVAAVALNLKSASGQTADMLDVSSFAGTKGDLFKVDKSGNVTYAGALTGTLLIDFIKANNYTAIDGTGRMVTNSSQSFTRFTGTNDTLPTVSILENTSQTKDAFEVFSYGAASVVFAIAPSGITTAPGLILKAASGQTAALIDTTNSTASTHYFQVTPSGHLILGGTLPTLTNGTNAASATITAGSTDAKGDCTVTTTAAPAAATTLISVVYSAAYATAPEVHIQAYGPNAASALLYVSARSTTGFTLTSVNAPPASTTVLFGYMVIQ